MIKRYISNRQIAEDTDDTQDPIDPTDNTNTLGDVFQAIKRAILTVKEEENNDDSPPLFKTVAIDTGQFERVMSKVNTEYETAFPACFVRFTNVHFLVAQQRIGEGRGIIRIRFILNKLDNQHVNWETYPFYIAERLNKAIQDAKKVEEALQERCNLMYFDTPQSTNMLQAYWLDYEIYFKITSSYKYADWIKKKVITPLHYIRIALLWSLLWLYSLLHLWSLRLLCSLLHLWLWFLLICLVQCIHTRLNCILHAVPYLLYLLLLRSRFVWLRVFAACVL